ncbi:MAG: stage III sporulation protein AC [Clostridia bacterium]|nr:stage III sporulation protein AC [Clostridia bacterium]
MGVDIILKIAGIGILIAVVAQVLKQAGKEEIATLATLTGLIVVLMMVIDMIGELFNTVQNLFSLY